MSNGWGHHHDEDDEYRLNLPVVVTAEQVHNNTTVPDWAPTQKIESPKR